MTRWFRRAPVLLAVACGEPTPPPAADVVHCTADVQGDSELLLTIDPAVPPSAVVEVDGVSCGVGGAAVMSIAVASSEHQLARLRFRDAVHTTEVWAPLAPGGRLVFHWTTGAPPLRFDRRLSGPDFEACAEAPALDDCPVGRLMGSGGRVVQLVPGSDGLAHVWDEDLLVVARAGLDYAVWRGVNGQDPPVQAIFLRTAP